jgi:hypothetical protein
MSEVHYDFSLLTDDDLYMFNEGSHFELYEKMGSHPVKHKGEWDLFRGLGARCGKGCRHGGIQRLGQRQPLPRRKRTVRNLGRLHSRHRTRA